MLDNINTFKKKNIFIEKKMQHQNHEEGSFWHGSLCSFTFSALLLRSETRLGRLLCSEFDFFFLAWISQPHSGTLFSVQLWVRKARNLPISPCVQSHTPHSDLPCCSSKSHSQLSSNCSSSQHWLVIQPSCQNMCANDQFYCSREATLIPMGSKLCLQQVEVQVV